jgi:Zn ribbon nucleic-acid-binding protein
MSVCPQCQTDEHLRLQRRDGEPGYQCDRCGTWLQFGALPPRPSTKSRSQLHKANPGRWPEDFPLDADGKVEEGLVVWSKSGDLEGRTTGARQRCSSIGCPGWFVAVTWETGQALRPCSEGTHYDADTKSIRITGGGEITARFASPPALPVDPLPREEWPTRAALSKRKGWRITSRVDAEV